MRKYMWPASCLPSPTVLIDAARSGAQGRLALDSVENHSARTFSDYRDHAMYAHYFDRLWQNPSRVEQTL